MRRSPLAATVLVALCAATPALAATVQSSTPPAQLRTEVDSGAYAKSLAVGWAKASKALDAQLAKKPAAKHPAVVLDIDETSMSNVACLEAADFALSGLATCVLKGQSKAIPGAKAFYKKARAAKVRVFFVTGAPEALCVARAHNLTVQGFGNGPAITCKPASYTTDSLIPYKSGARAAIEKAGNTILVNVGDQQSDLAGGHARTTVKLPNPFYTTS